MNEKCHWNYDDTYDCWDTGCNETFGFWDDGPAENGFKFCPFCGKEIEAENE